jgi:hypothetical protein
MTIDIDYLKLKATNTQEMLELNLSGNGAWDMEMWNEFIKSINPETILAMVQLVKESEKDTVRLDYIEKNCRCDPRMDGNNLFWPTTFNQALCGRTLRDAIDKKMEQTK